MTWNHDTYAGRAEQYRGASVEADHEALMFRFGVRWSRERYLEHVRLASEGLAGLQRLGYFPEGTRHEVPRKGRRYD